MEQQLPMEFNVFLGGMGPKRNALVRNKDNNIGGLCNE